MRCYGSAGDVPALPGDATISPADAAALRGVFVTLFGGRPRSVRTRLLLTVVVAVAAALALMTLGFNLLLWRGLSADADALARSRAAVEVSELTVVGGRVVPSELPDKGGLDSEAWLFVGGRAVDGPTVGRTLDQAARGAAATPRVMVDVPSEGVRLYALPAVVAGRRVAVIVVGVSMRPYQATRQTALIGSLALACALLAVVTLVTRWVLAAALRPVAEMTADAEAWSVRDVDRRFAADESRDELGQLAATLNGLLDRLSASLRREQRFSAELSHELRTPLSKICGEAELALRREREPSAYREALQNVLDNARTMARAIDTLVAAQRQQTGLARGSADSEAVLTEVAATCGALAGERGVDLSVRAPAGTVLVGVEPEVALRILQPIVENACHCAHTSVTLSVERGDGDVVFMVEDDGPGVLPGECERIFEPGVRGSVGDDGDGSRAFPGAGLGLALSRRLARAATGDVAASANGHGGRFTVRLPGG
jgi:signal transduction histidine kinase